MKHQLILFCLLSTWQFLQAQTISRQLISTFGGAYQSSNFSASYTVGETIITTMSNGNLTANQGFQQPACQTTSSSFNATALDAYSWNTNTYTQSGIYTQTFMNSEGCDSIITLSLIVYRTTLSMTMTNIIQTAPNVFRYDVMLTNTGNTTLALRGYSCGINHAVGMRNGGILTHTFISRDTMLSSIPIVTGSYTASTNHLRFITPTATAGNEVNLPPGTPIRLATMQVSNSVMFPGNFVPNFSLQTLVAAGKTICLATCIATPPGLSYSIISPGNTPNVNYLLRLTTAVEPYCFYMLNGSSQPGAVLQQNNPSSCYGLADGSAAIAIYGNGSPNEIFFYSLDNPIPYLNLIPVPSNPLILTNLSSGGHTVDIMSNFGCWHNVTFYTSEPPQITTSSSITACDSYTWQGSSYTNSGVYLHTLSSASGCDSIHSLNLTIHQSSYQNFSVSACNAYTWQGSTFTQSGIYTFSYSNASNCDSIIAIHLTVSLVSTPLISATGPTTFCDGDAVLLQSIPTSGLSFMWFKDALPIPGATNHSILITQPGLYHIQQTAIGNCSLSSAPQLIIVNNCDVDLSLKLFYQGYYTGSSTMASVLLNEGIGNDPSLVDTIVVELHSTLPPYGLVLSKTAILHTDGHALCTFDYYANNYYLADSYFVAIRHRNGLTTWSSNPVWFDSTSVSYDFTTSFSKAYGDNMVEVEPGVWAFYSGDFNYDENIDLLDNALLETDIANFLFGYYKTDVNGDGNSDLLDLPILETNIYTFIFSIQPAWSGSLPSVSTNPVTSITAGTAVSGGIVLSDGGSPILQKGVCWSVNPHPTVADSKTMNGGGNGSFSSAIQNLLPLSTYYVRAYATNSVGTIYGNELSFSSMPPLVVGQIYQGGVIAYILQPGDQGYILNEVHGIIAASNDQGTAQWGCDGTSIIGANGAGIGQGSSNTTAINMGCSTTGIASRVCRNLSIGGFNDWSLPSKDELNKVFINRSLIGGFNFGFYWSSTEYTCCLAWFQSFSSGLQGFTTKPALINIRAIRYF